MAGGEVRLTKRTLWPKGWGKTESFCSAAQGDRVAFHSARYNHAVMRLQTCIYARASGTHGATRYPTCHAQKTSQRSQKPLSLKHEDRRAALKYRWFILPFPPATCLDRHLLRQTKLTETNSERTTWIQMWSKGNNCSLVNGCGWVIYLCLWVCICSL